MKYKDFITLKIKELRQEKKLTQTAFAEKLGMQVSNYSRYEHGRRVPKEALLSKIIKTFNLENDYFDIPEVETSYLTKKINSLERELNRYRKMIDALPDDVSNFLKGNRLFNLDVLFQKASNSVTPLAIS